MQRYKIKTHVFVVAFILSPIMLLVISWILEIVLRGQAIGEPLKDLALLANLVLLTKPLSEVTLPSYVLFGFPTMLLFGRIFGIGPIKTALTTTTAVIPVPFFAAAVWSTTTNLEFVLVFWMLGALLAAILGMLVGLIYTGLTNVGS